MALDWFRNPPPPPHRSANTATIASPPSFLLSLSFNSVSERGFAYNSEQGSGIGANSNKQQRKLVFFIYSGSKRGSHEILSCTSPSPMFLITVRIGYISKPLQFFISHYRLPDCTEAEFMNVQFR
jgi:hypothetical protein